MVFGDNFIKCIYFTIIVTGKNQRRITKTQENVENSDFQQCFKFLKF